MVFTVDALLFGLGDEKWRLGVFHTVTQDNFMVSKTW